MYQVKKYTCTIVHVRQEEITMHNTTDQDEKK